MGSPVSVGYYGQNVYPNKKAEARAELARRTAQNQKAVDISRRNASYETKRKAEADKPKGGGLHWPISVGYFGQNVYGKSDEEKAAARKRAGARAELSRTTKENQSAAERKRGAETVARRKANRPSNAVLGYFGQGRSNRKASGQAATKVSKGASFGDWAKLAQQQLANTT